MSNVLNDEQIEQIKQLRLDRGLSIGDIQLITKFSKATVSKYCRGLRENNPISTDNSAGRDAYVQLCDARRNAARVLALSKWDEIRSDPVLHGFIALYWGEGTKRSKYKTGSVSIANSDPGIIAASIKALNRLGYSDFVLEVKIYHNQSEDECRQGWEKQLCRSIDKIRVANRWRYGKDRSNSRIYSKYGVCRLDVKKPQRLHTMIMAWIDCWRQELMVTEHCQL